MIGKKIAHYEVVEKLGQGSMGEVYRARDTRLGRDVALKVLPESLRKDPNRMARFEREARTLASLNHPNVAAIYGLEESDGVRCLVLELIEGETLRDRLRRGAIPPVQALEIAIQIAAALEATHENNIIHRDLNPENIRVLADGSLKVLDFGLAKVFMEGSEVQAPLSTKAGVLLGTPAYMSPEQTRAQDVDRRTDIWAFGCVLFEMLTGRRAFHEDTVPDTLAAVLEREPEWDWLPVGVGPSIRRLLRRCLEKDLRHRLRHIGDALLDIEETTDQKEEQTDAGVPRGLAWKSFYAGAGVVFVISAVSWILWSGSRPNAPVGTGFGVAVSRITDAPQVEAWPSVSGEGPSIVYASNASGNWDIYLQRIEGRNALNLTEGFSGRDDQPAFSPNGESIAFVSERNGAAGIFVMGATGESVRRLTERGANPTWSPDGTEILFSTESITTNPLSRGAVDGELFAVRTDTQQERLILTGADAVQPSWSPNGNRIAYWGLEAGTGQRDIWTIPAAGGEPVPVMQDLHTDWNPVWSPDGQYLYFVSDRAGGMNVWRVPIDEESGVVQGPLEQITTGGSSQHMHLAFVGAGDRIAYAERRSSVNIYKTDFDPRSGTVAQNMVPVTGGHLQIAEPDLSADGEWLAYRLSSPGEHIIVSRADGSEVRQLTNDEFKNRAPRWSPAGNRLAFFSDRSGSYEVWLMNPDGSRQEQLSDTPNDYVINPVWSPDGSLLAYGNLEPRTYIIDPAKAWTDQTPRATPMEAWPRAWSEDGLVGGGASAPMTIHSLGTDEVLENPWDNGSSRWLDDRRLVFASGNEIRLLDVVTDESHVLVTGPVEGSMSVAGFSPDKRTLYFSMSSEPESDIWLMTLDR